MKRALVISGGGSKGAFAVGALHEISKTFPNLRYDAFIGTSTGALIAPFAALGDLKLLKKIYTTSTNKDILKKPGLGNQLKNKKNSVYNVNPLWDLLEKNLTDKKCNDILQNGIEVYILTACLQTQKLTVFSTVNFDDTGQHYDTVKIESPSHFRKAVLASACQPVFMPPVMINKNISTSNNPKHQYVDGGMVEYAGVEIAIDADADEVFTILLSPKDKINAAKNYKGFLDILKRTIDIFSNDVGVNDLRLPEIYNEGLEYIEAVKRKFKRLGVTSDIINDGFNIQRRESPFKNKKPINLHYIYPSLELNGGPGGLDFVPQNMLAMFNQGKQDIGGYIAMLDASATNGWV